MVEAWPEDGKFVMPYDTTGASKVNPEESVPTVAPTETVTMPLSRTDPLDLQPTDVPDVQLAVAHEAEARIVDTVRSVAAKLRPVTVTDVIPL